MNSYSHYLINHINLSFDYIQSKGLAWSLFRYLFFRFRNLYFILQRITIFYQYILSTHLFLNYPQKIIYLRSEFSQLLIFLLIYRLFFLDLSIYNEFVTLELPHIQYLHFIFLLFILTVEFFHENKLDIEIITFKFPAIFW